MSIRIVEGCTRIVLLTSKYAVKIPNFRYEWRHFLKGLINNIEEAWLSKLSQGNVEPFASYCICPVLFSIPGGWLSIMPRCERLTDKQWDVLEKTDAFPELDDWKPENFGVLDGLIVQLDYART